MLTVVIGGTADERLAARRRAAGVVFLEELESGSVTPEELALRAGTPTLTGETRGFFMRGVFSGSLRAEKEESVYEEDVRETERVDDGETREAFLSLAEGLCASPHIFVFEEEKVPARTVATLRLAGASVSEFEKEKKAEPFNVFAMARAFESGDKKRLWLLLVRALRAGVAPENVAGILTWKARTSLASSRTQAEKERWRIFSRNLVVAYHESHRGGGELALLLERFVLSM